MSARVYTPAIRAKLQLLAQQDLYLTRGPKTRSIGMRFGKLEVIRPVGHNRHHHLIVLAHCDCGGAVINTLTRMKNGLHSCGCLKAKQQGGKYGELIHRGFLHMALARSLSGDHAKADRVDKDAKADSFNPADIDDSEIPMSPDRSNSFTHGTDVSFTTKASDAIRELIRSQEVKLASTKFIEEQAKRAGLAQEIPVTVPDDLNVIHAQAGLNRNSKIEPVVPSSKRSHRGQLRSELDSLNEMAKANDQRIRETGEVDNPFGLLLKISNTEESSNDDDI